LRHDSGADARRGSRFCAAELDAVLDRVLQYSERQDWKG
jgi:hypothetical protein